MVCGWCVLKCQNMSKNKLIHTCIYDIQKIHKEEYVDGNMVWVPLCTDVHIQNLFFDTFVGDRLFSCEEIDTNLLKETFEKMFNYIIIMLNEKYNFCIGQYQSFRHNLMKNDGCIKNDQIVHRDFKIL